MKLNAFCYKVVVVIYFSPFSHIIIYTEQSFQARGNAIMVGNKCRNKNKGTHPVAQRRERKK